MVQPKIQPKIQTNILYRLLNLQTGTYLTRRDSDNVAIVGGEYNAENGQEWKLLAAGEGHFFIQAADADQFIAVPLGSIDQAQQLECNIAPFAWKVVAANHMATVVRFMPMGDRDLNFDLWGGNPAEGTKIALHSRTGNNQLWILEKVRRSMHGEQLEDIVEEFILTEQQSTMLSANVDVAIGFGRSEEDIQQSTMLSANAGVAIGFGRSEEDIEVDVKFTEEVTLSKKSEFEFGAAISALSIDGGEGYVEERVTELPSVDNDEGNVDLVVA